jgi:glycosyltransferase involved in cell wall biosynthesis
MSNVDFSVVIPTYNRSQILVKTLQALADQRTLESGELLSYEVIVVDDGSTDDTEDRVRDLQGRILTGKGQPSAGSRQLRYFRQSNRKQGAARNLGAKHARGEFLVFLGDDTTPAPDFLSRHASGRRTRAEWIPDSRLVLIGRTRWADHLPTTRFMDYIGEQGWQFGFALITDPENVPFNFFYTSNLSISRRFFLESGGFDEDFREYGWEDIELSLRLRAQGMRLVYQPTALTWHDHPTSLRSFIGRQRKVGYSAWKFYGKHPEMAEFLSVLKVRSYPLSKKVRMSLLTVLCSLSETRNWPDLSRYYPDLMSYYYNLGILEARGEK